MLYTNLVFTALVASVSASAIPMLNGLATIPALRTRGEAKEVYKNPNGGDLKITFSQESVNLGVRNPGDIMNMLYDACSDTVCESLEKELDSSTYTESKGTDIHIKVTPDGDYKNQDRGPLMQVLNDAAWSIMKCNTVVYKQRGGCPGPVPCPSPPDETHIICEVPQFWSVQTGDNNGMVKVQISSEADTKNKDWCANLTGAGSSVAGFINENAAIGFDIASIMCNLA